jgi:hypothetical protein
MQVDRARVAPESPESRGSSRIGFGFFLYRAELRRSGRIRARQIGAAARLRRATLKA